MKKIISIFSKEFYIPLFDKIGKTISSFSLTEKVVFSVFAIIFIGSSLSMLLKINEQFLVEVPRHGGTLKEGVIGTPRFINPVLALSETDRDLTALVYSGLMRLTPNGDLIPDLAESMDVSEDGLVYTFKIRNDAVFQDGKSVTSDDVIFTILKIQDPLIKSPKRANWDGIVIERISDKELSFVLTQPYSPFVYNTTLGILPRHIWQDITSGEFSFSEFNSKPIGSGPFKVSDIKKNKSGISEIYKLESFNQFTLGKPNIENIEFHFYKNEESLIEGLNQKDISAVNSISPEKAIAAGEDGFRVLRFSLPRIFGVFFNQSEAPVLATNSVRKALDTAVDKEEIINSVLKGYAKEATGPIPPTLIPFEVLDGKSTDINHTEEAISILNDAGWSLNENGYMQKGEGGEILSFSVTTVNVPELVSVAEKVVEDWKKIGADVNLKIFDPNDLNQNVIRPRNYDALLFGEIIGRDLDFYAFWHSSQRIDPGLNIADYANINVDKALEEARGLDDSAERIEKFRIFEKAVKEDVPAIFLYSPDFVYVVPEKLRGIFPESITTPSERFADVYSWYLETDRVWKIFK